MSSFPSRTDLPTETNVFAMQSTTGVAQTHCFYDEKTQLKAIVAVHNTKLGPALGGCRFKVYENEQQAFYDVTRLAQGMSYKAALAGIPFGGGKAAIMKPEGDYDRSALFEAFGRALNQLQGQYITAMDSGVEMQDMDAIAKQSTFVSGQTDKEGDPSPYTARGILMGIKASAKWRWGSELLKDKRVLVQGVGHVGMVLCEHLHAQGAQLLVSDVVDSRVDEACQRFGAQAIDANHVFDTPCDIFSPCGLGAVLDDASIAKLDCEIVAGGANNQLLDPVLHAQQLMQKGVLYAPDFVINAAGVIHAALRYQGECAQTVENKIDQIGHTLTMIYQAAKLEAKSTGQVAVEMARAKLQ